MDTPTTRTLGIGLFGTNGHQILGKLEHHSRARAVALAGFSDDQIPAWAATIPRYNSLDELLDDPAVELISLCSPLRSEQTDHAITCLERGRHVLAEKPCALNEPDLDRLLAAVSRTGRYFHEMGGSAFEHPYREFFQLIRDGAIGTVRQIHAQKSYPNGQFRPRDPAVNGGMFLQVGIHAARWIDHGLGFEIHGGNVHLCHDADGKPISASAILDLGGSASCGVTVNYLNPRGFPSWGNESLRVWGDDGLAELWDAGTHIRLTTQTDAPRSITPVEVPAPSWLDRCINQILLNEPFPLSLEAELRPLRGLLRSRIARNMNLDHQ